MSTGITASEWRLTRVGARSRVAKREPIIDDEFDTELEDEAFEFERRRVPAVRARRLVVVAAPRGR